MSHSSTLSNDGSSARELLVRSFDETNRQASADEVLRKARCERHIDTHAASETGGSDGAIEACPIGLVHYCPACGGIGDADHAEHRFRCLHQGRAHKVPRVIAEQARRGFDFREGLRNFMRKAEGVR